MKKETREKREKEGLTKTKVETVQDDAIEVLDELGGLEDDSDEDEEEMAMRQRQEEEPEPEKKVIHFNDEVKQMLQ